MKILISGSRDCLDGMLEKAIESVKYINFVGAIVVVGDARGVDKKVLATCHAINQEYECYGATPKPRVKFVTLSRYTFVDTEGTWKQRFLARDRKMADIADEGIFIWNGESGGTIYTYKYMEGLGKPVELINFKELL